MKNKKHIWSIGLNSHNGCYVEAKIEDAFEFKGKDITEERMEYYNQLFVKGSSLENNKNKRK